MTMKKFSGYEYLLIDAANQYGHDLDKLTFEPRIEWTMTHLNELEAMAPQSKKKTRPLYLKAVAAIRKAQARVPTGHMVEFDAVCSGVQLMSVLTGCIAGATATGLVDPNVRADAYTLTTETMRAILGNTLSVIRDDAKAALMTSFYGSKKTPKDIFGEDTPELNAFYQAAYTVAPGAWNLLQALLASWQPWALQHAWKLPDGFDARVKVMVKDTARIEVDELDHATFSYEYYENQGSERGLSNVANTVHSIDAYVLRSVHRRCNYDLVAVTQAQAAIAETLDLRKTYPGMVLTEPTASSKLEYYLYQWDRSGMADIVILPHIDSTNVHCLPSALLKKLASIIDTMTKYKPFPVVTVHDAFRCHANNMNHLRAQYIEILADLADSEVLTDILSQIHGYPVSFPKMTNNLSTLIRGSSYAIC